MIHPTYDQLSSNNKFDRYTVTAAAAKGARMVTDEYVAEREVAEQMIAHKETDKSINELIDEDIRDERAVHTAVYRILSGDYEIIDPAAEEEYIKNQKEAQLAKEIEEGNVNTSSDSSKKTEEN